MSSRSYKEFTHLWRSLNGTISYVSYLETFLKTEYKLGKLNFAHDLELLMRPEVLNCTECLHVHCTILVYTVKKPFLKIQLTTVGPHILRSTFASTVGECSSPKI